jgi:hypothetical protein
MPAPLPLGQSGASLVEGGSERRVSAAWMPLTKTGRSPGIRDTQCADDEGDADVTGSIFRLIVLRHSLICLWAITCISFKIARTE